MCALPFSSQPQHGALTAPNETCADEPTGGAVSGLLGAVGGFSGVIEHVSSLNISMEHVVDYGEPGGKVQCACHVVTNRYSISRLAMLLCGQLPWCPYCLSPTPRAIAFVSCCCPFQIFASGATVLASFGSFLIMVGFKVGLTLLR